MRRGIQHIAVRGLRFLYGYAKAGDEVGNHKASVFVRRERAVGIAQADAVAVADKELRAFQRRCRSRDVFLHGQRCHGIVIENERLRIVRAYDNGLTARRFVYHIPGNRGKFRYDKRSGHARQQDFSRAVRREKAVAGGTPVVVWNVLARRGRDTEHHAGERPLRQTVELFNQKRTFTGIPKG